MGIRCEEFALKYLPMIRRELVNILYEKYNMSQSLIAKKLLITQASVSQYLNGVRRRNKIEFSEEEKNIIMTIAEELTRRDVVLSDLMIYICKICDMRNKGISCHIYNGKNI